jgi:type I restriction-modification system DNA methylase subunit
MLMLTKEHMTAGVRGNGDFVRPALNPAAGIHLFGQEVSPETWAVSKSDLFMKDPTGRDADNIAYGSVLSKPGAGLPQVEGIGRKSGRRLLREKRPGDRQASAGERVRVHPYSLPERRG